ncbi:MAG TPA: hypothetical protein PKC03_16660 [Dokdonella sp.]|nr:hypothetical protein [Dokdonella sp.]
MSKRIDPERDLERLLDPDAGEFGAIYRRLSRPEPPRRLDRVVLAQAARAIHGNRAPRAQRWMLGLGSAAGLVLAAGIAWQVGRQLETRDSLPAGAADTRGSTVIPVQPIAESARLQKSGKDASLEDKENIATTQADEPKAALKARRQAPGQPPAPAVAPPPPAAPMARKVERASAPEEPATLSAPAEAEAFPAREDSARDGAVAGASGELGSERRAEPSGAGAADAMQAPPAAKADAPQSRAPAPTTSIQLRQNMHLPPEEWLAEIVRLKREGHRQQAIENLRLFRRMHPDWRLPDELLRLSR